MATILVVDDEEPIVALLREILEEEGHTVFAAYNGRDGLALARQVDPDLVLSDVMKPLMDGVHLSRMLHADGERAVSVILMSAAGPPDTAKTGAAAFLSKPFTILSKPFTIVRVIALIAAHLTP